VFRRTNLYNSNRDIIKRSELVKQPSKEYARQSPIAIASAAQVDRMAPRPFSPFYEESNLNLPRERAEVNAWCRHYYNTDPLIGNAIDLHSTYPLSSMGVKCEYPEIKKFFNDMLDELNFGSLIYDIAREYMIIGEVFPYCQLDANTGKWSEIIIQNPDYIEVRKHSLTTPVISLRPDAELQRIITSTNPDDISLRQQLDPEIVSYVMSGKSIPLDNHLISHIARKSSPYDVRGTSILTRVFKDLMYRDILREAQFSIAQNHVTPLRIAIVGNQADSFRPGSEDLMQVRDMLEQATYDPDFTIIAHTGFDLKYVGVTGQVLPLDGEFDRIEDRILTGLYISKAFTHGEGPTYSNASVALEVLQQRYVSFRNIIERWLERKVFAPICRVQDFARYKNGIKELIIPKVDWQKINLKNNREYQSALDGLARENIVSKQALFESLDLDYKQEISRIKDEIEDQKEIAYKLQTPYMGKENINVATPDEPMPQQQQQGEGGPGGGGGGLGGGGDMGGGGEPGGDLGGGDLGLGGDLGGGAPGGEAGGGAGAPPAAGGGAPAPAV
jgi:hypothetical protein